MQLILDDVGKRFKKEWVVRGLTHSLASGARCALVGANGIGKSTLLRLISGQLSPSKGSITFQLNQKKLPIEAVYRQIAIAAPYVELIEEFNLLETIAFQSKFKPFIKNLTINDIANITYLPKSAYGKEIRYFSSGMKQRLKLALAICADAPLLLLDEPTTNLDQEATNWFHTLLNDMVQNRTLVIASNVPSDLAICTQSISLSDYK